MSRIARKPLQLPSGVTIQKSSGSVLVKGKKGEFSLNVSNDVNINIVDNSVKVSLKEGSEKKNNILGTTIILLKNVITGVHEGFERKLQLVGVGYRAKAQGNKLELSLGYSHPVVYVVPKGMTVETPSNTEIIIKSIDKGKLGQVVSDIRDLRPPESYKGKGVRYADERIILKETKKK